MRPTRRSRASTRQGKIVGFEVDYANALCAKMHVTCTFQNQDWDGIIPALLGGKFDAVMSSMNETPARAKRVLFSDVYYATPPVWVTTKANKSDDISPAALKGKAIGTQSSTTFANYLEKFYKGFEVKLYPGGDEPLADLANGRLDYVVLDLCWSARSSWRRTRIAVGSYPRSRGTRKCSAPGSAWQCGQTMRI